MSLTPSDHRTAGLMTLGACLLSGCAGPTTPLGAPWVTSSSELFDGTLKGTLSMMSSLFEKNDKEIEIRFSPAHQNLHSGGPLSITVHDPQGIKSNYRLIIRHNGLDVTASFIRQADVVVTGNDLHLRVPLLRLPADRENRIEVVYGRKGGSDGDVAASSYALYEPPVCRAFSPQSIVSLEDFSPPAPLLEQIRRLSISHRFNPAFTAGLIAQESGFDPRTVSWAKAIGLTQITQAAEDEIVGEYEDWPRYPGINELPAALVKALVASGHANPSNEWRLDSERSIDGGLLYLEMLAEHWSEPLNLARIRAVSAEPDVALTRLILASYNSGYARVAQAFSRDGANWLADPELHEARKYVNRIMSYCDRFASNGEPI